MKERTMTVIAPASLTAGLDLGDRTSHFCLLDGAGNVVERGTFSMGRGAVERQMTRLRRKGVERVALEVGTHSPWLSRLLHAMGFEVYVANARKVQLVSQNTRKTDRVDAELLARLCRVDPRLLSPIEHRGAAAQADLALLKSRGAVVDSRTQLVNHVRGIVKAWGARLPSCSTDCFHKKVAEHVPDELAAALAPVIKQIGCLTETITAFDKQIEKRSEERYPEVAVLRQIKGVGPITALTYALTIESPERIHKTRNVGAYLGLVPREFQSGGKKPELRITKAGDATLRSLLVSSAHYILGPFGEDSDLRRFGERIASKGGKGAKKRAIIAVARKLSIVLLRLWQTGEQYEPLRNSTRRRGEAEQVAQA